MGSNRTGRKVVKFHKEYLITIDGKTDTVHPDETPYALSILVRTLKAMMLYMGSEWKSVNVTIEEK